MGWLVSGTVKETDQSCLKKNFSEDDFVFRNGFVLGSEKKRKHGRG